MADLATRCQNQLASFRIRELKDVLTRLGLPKQGKKQILMDKIMGVVSPAEKLPVTKGVKGDKKHVVTREEAVKVIDEAYRLLRSNGATDLAGGGKNKSAKSGSSSGYHTTGQVEAAGRDDPNTRCPCGNSMDMGTMLQCEDPTCGVWQHMNCVVIAEKLGDGGLADFPSVFCCELCRIARGDPFCVALSHPLLPTKLSSTVIQAEGSNTLQTIEKSFTLTRADRDLLHHPNHELQIWCVLLSDKVSFRMHWPSFADVRVNGVPVRVTNRPGQQLLGANGRDEGPGVTGCTREGLNRLSMSAYDGRPFCVGIRIIQRRSLQQVLALIPSEKEGEPFEEAMARVCRCIKGGGGAGLGAEDDDDSDLEVVADSITVNLRCPMSGSRIKVAGRFKPCLHLGCFDLDTYVELNQRARKWQCPICLKNYSIETLIIDPFLNLITGAVKNLSEEMTEVELRADGSWRPKLEGDERFREPWRLPVPQVNGVIQHKTIPAALPNPVKVEEGRSSQEQGSLKLGIKRTAEGVWTINGPRHMNGGPSQKRKKPMPKFSKSSSATDSNMGDEDEQSVNQDPSEKLADSSEENGEVTFPPKAVVEPAGGVRQISGADAPNDTDVIVLSDTDDEEGADPVLGSSGASVHSGSDTLANSGLRSPDISVANDTHGDSSGLALGTDTVDMTRGVSSHSLPFNPLGSTRVGDGTLGNSIGLGLQPDNNNFWSLPEENVSEGQYSYFGSQAEAGANHHPPPVRPTPLQAVAGSGFLPTSLIRVDSRRASGWAKYRHTRVAGNVDTDDGSEDSDRAVSPTERQFMLPEPVRAQVPTKSREPLMPEKDIDDSWFSLRLGGVDSIVESVPTPGGARTSQEPQAPTSQAKGRGLESVSSASVLLGMSSNGTTRARPNDTRVPGRSHSSGAGYTVPVRPRSSPLHVRRPYHRQFRVDESDTDWNGLSLDRPQPPPARHDVRVPFSSSGETSETCSCGLIPIWFSLTLVDMMRSYERSAIHPAFLTERSAQCWSWVGS